jgi:hypothetical protein
MSTETLEFSLLESPKNNAMGVRSRAARLLGTCDGNEGSDLSQEIDEGGLVAEENMICAVKVHEARPGYTSS